MKYDPSLYEAVVSQFFTDDVIKLIEENVIPKRPTDSSIDLTPEIELTNRMINFAIQYNGFERKQHYTQEEMERISAIRAILNDKLKKIENEIIRKDLESLSPAFKKLFPNYKSLLNEEDDHEI